MLRGLLLILILALSASGQVPLGATKQEVIDRLGWPKSTSTAADRELLYYPEFSVLLVNGRVEKLQFTPKDGKLPNTYSPPARKPAPEKPAPAKTQPPIKQPTRAAPTKPVVEVSPPAAPVQRLAAQPVEPIREAPRVERATTVPPRVASRPSPPPDHFALAKRMIYTAFIVGAVIVGLRIFLLFRNRRAIPHLKPYFAPTNHASTPPSPWPTHKTTAPRQPAPLRGWSLRLLNEIEWHRFEQVVAAYERELGNDAELTPFGPDGGVDVLVFDKNSRTPKRVIQCKAFEKDVGVKLVRELLGVMRVQKAPRGALYATSRFTDDAIKVAMQDDAIELVDGPTFLNRIQRLHDAAQVRLLAIATEGDYTTPTCANCGIKLTFHPVTKGAPYWECRNRPRCKSRIYVSRTA